MKVLVVGSDYADGFAPLIAEALGKLGHLAHVYEPGPPAHHPHSDLGHQWEKAKRALWANIDRTSVGQAWLRRQLVQTVERFGQPDLVICCHDFLTPALVHELKLRTRAPVALWFPDAISNFGRHMFLNAPYDALFFKDPYIVHQLRRTLRRPIYYLPECFSPDALGQQMGPVQREDRYLCDIATAGNLYSYRIALFEQLQGRDVKIWGNPAAAWAVTSGLPGMVQAEYVAGATKAKLFQCAKIVLNNLHPAEIWGINARAFEIAGAGGFQLIDWRPALGALFDIGREVVAFTDFADLSAKLDYYLAADHERAEIAAAGQRRAISEHTYEHRLRLMLDTLSGAETGFAWEAPAATVPALVLRRPRKSISTGRTTS